MSNDESRWGAPIGGHADSGERTPVAARAYTGIWAWLVRWFRVPEHPPTLPTAPGEVAHSFRPSPAYLRCLKLLFWIGLLVIDIILTILWIVATIALVSTGLWFLAIPLAPIAIALIVLPDIVAYIGIHLRYDTTWYVLTNRSLRVRHGIWIIRELTLTFENVQNVRLSQGPLQRYFGFASVVVETAGGGGSAAANGQSVAVGHHASIDGITNAEEIRDLILARVRASRSAGLGDDRGLAGAHSASVRGNGSGAASGGPLPAAQGVHDRAGLTTPRQQALLCAIRDELRAANQSTS